jgi:hypothetical protein
MKVWHGSYTAIENVDFTFCEKSKDFGRGFYVTNLPGQARTWATRIGLQKNREGVVTEFEYNENIPGMMKLKTLKFDDYNDEWLDFVVINRRNDSDTPAHDYDIIEGPVADDKVATEVERYMEGAITREQFLRDLVYTPSHQICFCTVQSLQALSLPKGRIDIDIYDIGWEIMRALVQEYGVSEIEATDLYFTSQTFASVADESTGYYKKPWSEIYAMLQTELKI